EHEDELKHRIATREVEPGHVRDRREAAGEGGEEEEREDQGRQEQRRVRVHAVKRPPGDGPDDRARSPHVRAILVRRATLAAARPTTTTPTATPKASARASASHPVIKSDRMPSIRYETGL